MLNSARLVKPLKIAISGKSGCGNSSLVSKLATILSVNQINYTFRNLAIDHGLSFEEVRKQAETDDQFDRMVDAKQVELAQQGSCVLGSRLAIWVLPDADLKVYLDISIEERARRIYKRENGSLEHKMHETIKRDALDHDRYLRIYGIDNNQFSFADLVVSDIKLSVDEIAMQVISKIPASYFEH